MSSRVPQKRGSLRMASIAGLIVVLAASIQKVRPDDSDAIPRTDCSIDALLQSLLMPDQYSSSLQVQALRQDLIRLINAKENPEYDMLDDDSLLAQESQYGPDKRSLASLARNGLVPKRNIGSLMRSGFYRPSDDGKRSIATLAKNGQLPTLQSPEEEVEEEKRNLASLARSGLLQTGYKRNLESMARNGYLQGKRDEDKRNIGSIAKSGYYNLADKRYLGSLAQSKGYPFYKRNLGSIARDGYVGVRSPYFDNDYDKRNVQALMKNGLPTSSSGKRNIASIARSRYPFTGYEGKRNIGALARDWSLPNHANIVVQDEEASPQSYDDKRNLASLKAHEGGKRSKRSIFRANTDEYPLPVMQNANGFEYENLLAELNDQYETEQKRFLGNIPQQRLAELGRISMTPTAERSTQSTPTYRRRQYLLTRNKEVEDPDD